MTLSTALLVFGIIPTSFCVAYCIWQAIGRVYVIALYRWLWARHAISSTHRDGIAYVSIGGSTIGPLTGDVHRPDRAREPLFKTLRVHVASLTDAKWIVRI